MDSKHTPGPWHAAYAYTEKGGETVKYWKVTSKEWELVAPVSVAGNAWPEGSPGERRAKANAHMIAAAPLLRTAVEIAIERLQHLGDTDSAAYDILRAAASKAES